MKPVSLTTFVDFVTKTAKPKLTVVKTWKHKPPYSPQIDYWKRFRDAVYKLHKNGKSKRELNALVGHLTDKKKQVHYPVVINGYKKWLGRKKTVWINHNNKILSIGNFRLNVNPELGLEINGVPHLIKLYPKADKLSKRKAELITNAMALAYNDPNYVYALLDVRNSRLYDTRESDTDIQILLEGEAAYWQSIYSRI